MLVLLVMMAGLLVAVVIHRLVDNSRHNYPPGPISIPFFGSPQQFAIVNSAVHEVMEKLGEKYGNLIFFRYFLDEPVLMVRGYELIKEATHNRAFSGVGRQLSFHENGLNKRLGLMFSEGENWHHMRRFAVRALHKQEFGRKSRSESINEELAEVMELLLKAAAAGHSVPVTTLFSVSSMNSLLHLVAGEKLSRDGEAEKLIELVSNITISLGPQRVLLDTFPWLRWVAPKLSGYQQLLQEICEMVDRMRPIVSKHRTQLQLDQPPKDLVEDYLQQQQHERNADVFTDNNLLLVVKDLLAAGMETGSRAMEWIILHLVQHPEKQVRAAAEVAAVIGHERPPHIEDMLKMPYLEAIIEETLRYKPLVPIVQHATTFGSVKLGDYDVPANCRVLYDMNSVVNDKEFWGDPEQFRPERFLVPNAAPLYERITAFGLGIRKCIGETHARQLMFLSTAGLLQRLELQLCPGQEDPGLCEPNLLLHPRPFTISVQIRR